jgi:arylsulfatase
MRVFIGVVLLIVLFGCKPTIAKHDLAKPNVILVFIDDEGYGDVGCYGATGFQTPNLDEMANKGMRFTNFYSAQPVCSASRAGLMTGCYPNRIGIAKALVPSHKIGLNANEYTIGEMFQDQGYATACFGKWHLGWQKPFLPLQQGFDEYVGLPYSNDMWPRSNVTAELVPEKDWKSKYPELPLIEGNEAIDTLKTLQDQDKLTTLYTEKAVDFINRNANQPFFLYVPHSMGHVPLGVSDKFRGKSEQGLYGDVMMEIDWSVGEILKAVDKNKLTDNTIVIFTTDNGPWLNYGNHAGSAGGLKEGKLTSWEGGQRVPCIVKWPNHVPAGKVCNKLACAIDLLPTLASLTQGELSENKIDGVDISALLKGNFDQTPRQTILYYFEKNNLNAVRKGNWKLVLPHNYKSYDAPVGNDGNKGEKVKKSVEEPELYDMRRDPGEQFNVIASYPEKVTELMQVVEEARAELGDLNVGIKKGSGTREVGHLKK